MAQIDETNVDTPSGHQEGSSLSIEDAFFSDSIEGTTTEETNVVQEAVSEDGSKPVSNPVTSNDNDERRYQYWQSQADKVKNENSALKQQLNTMQSQINNVQQAQAPVQEQPAEEFPPPPDRPEKPSGFTRADALEDPSSPSARYLDEVETWRDKMTEYSAMKSEYNNAVLQERLDKEEQVRVENIKRAQAQQQANQQLRGIYEEVQGHHGLSEQEAQSFISDMSKPDSLNIDNLVELWRIKNGSGAAMNQAPAQPSETFNQQARAQQVASPMGVLPSQQPVQKSSEESIMDSMINDYKKSNPW
tara:strand:+ start:528 stop:1439 length:912 start_codon:yes stop_codon:yes gene_type:complete